jgi:hypothetical protein
MLIVVPALTATAVLDFGERRLLIRIRRIWV